VFIAAEGQVQDFKFYGTTELTSKIILRFS
jgi:hypothetical protein